jgi:hypothetical protein
MPRVGFEPTIRVLFERAKTVHALDRAAAVIGLVGNIPVYKHGSTPRTVPETSLSVRHDQVVT